MPDERTERTGSPSAIAARYALALTTVQLARRGRAEAIPMSVSNRENGGHD